MISGDSAQFFRRIPYDRCRVGESLFHVSSSRPSPTKRGASQDLGLFEIVLYFWIPGLAQNHSARPVEDPDVFGRE